MTPKLIATGAVLVVLAGSHTSAYLLGKAHERAAQAEADRDAAEEVLIESNEATRREVEREREENAKLEDFKARDTEQSLNADCTLSDTERQRLYETIR